MGFQYTIDLTILHNSKILHAVFFVYCMQARKQTMTTDCLLWYLTYQVGAEQAEHLLDVSQLVVWGGVGGFRDMGGGGKGWACCSLHCLSITQWVRV